MCEARQQRGIVVAAMSKIVKNGPIWNVTSQSRTCNYVVSADPKYIFCSCPDFESRHQKCKHIYAVEYVMKREQDEHGNETVTESVTVTDFKRPTYPQKWKEYNMAQTGEKDLFQSLLRGLCDLIKEPNAKPCRGRPRIPMSDCVFMACYKVYSTVSQRRFMCDLEAAQKRGYLERTPHFNAIGFALDDEEMTEPLVKLIQASSLPLKEIETDFAVDSTGFMSSKFVRWFDQKYGKVRQEHTWVKLHAICGVKTNIVTAVEIHGRNAGDSPMLPSLVTTTAENFRIGEVSADAAYLSNENFESILSVGGDPFIAFKSNSKGLSGGTYAKAFHFFRLYREEFFQSYHKRSNIESTFSMIKRKYGDAVRSKTEVSMKNETLCKVLAHNISCLISAIFELGIDPQILMPSNSLCTAFENR